MAATSSVIFSDGSGLVLAVPNSGAGSVVPGRISVPGFAPAGALISGANYDQSVNVQFQSTLGRAVYVYVFGDNMGVAKIEGIAFQGSCGGGKKTGIEEILDYYDANRSSMLREPIKVGIGETAISGFLTGVSIRAVTLATDVAAAFSQYSLQIASLPRGK